MSARDAESGSSTYKGGSGRAGGLGNGGIGGGMGGGGNYGGGGGGGAGRTGGIGSRTGLTTGNRMIGGTAVGRPGGAAMNPGAWGIQNMPAVSQAPLNRPAVPGLLGPAAPMPTGYPEPVVEDVPMLPQIPRTYVPSPPAVHPAPYPPAPSTYDPYRFLNQPRPTGGPYQPADMSKMPSIGSSVSKSPGLDPRDLAARNWSGPRQNIGAIGGGQGVTGYSSGGAPGFGGRR